VQGYVYQRSPGKWYGVWDGPPKYDPVTGKVKRNQKARLLGKTKREAEAKLNELIHATNKGQFVEPSKITVAEWLDQWLETVIKPTKRLRTYETYESVIRTHMKPAIGAIRLQQLKATDVKRYYLDKSETLSQATLEQHHTIICSALKAAEMQDMIQRNVASLVPGKPRAGEGNTGVLNNCWEAEEARRFIAAAKEFGPQPAAFYSLALDSGARKAELCGLKWSDIDLEAGTVSIVRQLVKPGPNPVFGPPKNGTPRTIHIGQDTLEVLRAHKAHQDEIKAANLSHYHDHGLAFAKEWEQVGGTRDTLGDPLQMNNMGQREFRKIIRAAGVRPIKFHGLRHTCATLALQAGVSVKVVQERLGHKRIEITMGTYAHALPSMQQDASAKINQILHGK